LLSSLLVSVLATAGTACTAEPARDASIQNGGSLPQAVVALADTSANTGTITGRVFSQINGAVVEFAVVEIVAQDRVISALSDRSGRYRLDRVPPGSRLIRARALDHSELVIGVRVPPRGVLSLDLTLAVHPIEMSPLSARTSRVDAERVERVGVLAEEAPTGTPADAELRVLESSPGMAELGLVQIIQAASSPDPDDASSILYVRGATSDLKLVLLDGAPVYAPFHLGGLIQAFMPDVLGYSRPYVGGAPARFNGGLSYILDLGSRPGRTDRFHTSGALDMMSTRGEVEGPLPGGSFLASGRYIHGEGPDRLTGEELPYSYGDALVRMDWGIGREGKLSVTGFYNREGVDLIRDASVSGTENAIADEAPIGEDLVPDPPAPEARPKSPAEWGNVAGSVRYFGRAFDSDVELTAALGEFTTSLPLDGATPLLVDGLSRRMRVAGLMSRWVGRAQLELGASFDRVSLQHAARSTLDQTSTTFSSRSAGESVGAHAEATMRVLPALMVRGGLRADYFLADGLRVAPRLSVAWTFLKESSISVAAGRYHQRVLSPETLLSSEIGSFAEIASENPDGTTAATDPSALQVSSSTHLVAGINSRALEHFVVGLEGYVKSFEDLPVGPDLETSGLDFWIQRSAGKVNGWIGYSVAWYRPQYEGRKAVPRTLGRQLLSGGLSAQLMSGFGVDLNLAYGVALPFTPIPQGDEGSRGGSGFGGGDSPAPLLAVASAPGRTDPPPTSPLAGAARGSYLRLDGTIYRTWVFNWSGVPVSISPYIRILNALDRRDGLFFQFDPDQDRTPVSLGAVPLIPLIGVRWGL
jgi:hypothetical protein